MAELAITKQIRPGKLLLIFRLSLLAVLSIDNILYFYVLPSDNIETGFKNDK